MSSNRAAKYTPMDGTATSGSRPSTHHRVSFLRGHPAVATELLPRVHRVVSLLKRWLLGTHQGAVSHAHLDYYLDEFTFRFNRRTSRHRGKLFSDWSSKPSPSNPSRIERLCSPAPVSDGADTTGWGHLSEADNQDLAICRMLQ